MNASSYDVGDSVNSVQNALRGKLSMFSEVSGNFETASLNGRCSSESLGGMLQASFEPCGQVFDEDPEELDQLYMDDKVDQQDICIRPSSTLGPLVEEASLLCAQVDRLLGWSKASCADVSSILSGSQERAWLYTQTEEGLLDAGSKSTELHDTAPVASLEAVQPALPKHQAEVLSVTSAVDDQVSWRCSSWPKKPYDPRKYCEREGEDSDEDEEENRLQDKLRSCAEQISRRRQEHQRWQGSAGFA